MNDQRISVSFLLLSAACAIIATLFLAGCATAPPETPLGPAVATAARQGSPMAELVLGEHIVARAHTAKGRTAGVGWIRRAAQANLAMAEARLRAMYLSGTAVPQNIPDALKWLHRAAERGAPAAQLDLGYLYAVGALVPADKVQAYYWYSIAAMPVHSDVTIFDIRQVRWYALQRAQALAPSLTSAECGSVRRQVAAWLPTPSVPYSGSIPLDRAQR
ncbi:MAG: tetratricopeptide repeat protein [Steroidobacteraceae bacterium]